MKIILSAVSKIFERLLFSQINSYIDSKLSKQQCGFRKGLSAHHCLLVMLEKWRVTLDKKGFTGVLLTDLSIAFDCISHDLLAAKLDAYGFDYNAVKLIHDYLKIDFRGLELIHIIVRGMRLYTESLKDPYLAHCCSTFISVIYSCLLSTPIWQIIQMIILRMRAKMI